MIKFKYTMPAELSQFIYSTIANYSLPYLYGVMPDGLANNLEQCSLFLVSEFDENRDTQQKIYTNPVCVVAPNDAWALNTYQEVMQGKIGFILCVLKDKCDKLKVEPI